MIYLQKALQMAMFSSKAIKGRTIIFVPRVETMSMKVTTVSFVTMLKGGTFISGSPGGMNPMSLKGASSYGKLKSVSFPGKSVARTCWAACALFLDTKKKPIAPQTTTKIAFLEVPIVQNVFVTIFCKVVLLDGSLGPT